MKPMKAVVAAFRNGVPQCRIFKEFNRSVGQATAEEVDAAATAALKKAISMVQHPAKGMTYVVTFEG